MVPSGTSRISPRGTSGPAPANISHWSSSHRITSVTGLPDASTNVSSVNVDVLVDGDTSNGLYGFSLRNLSSNVVVADAGSASASTHITASNLVDGPYRLTLAAQDLAGNVDATAVVYLFTVDTLAPNTQASSGLPLR